jgi:YVTN family beta-propeller protein
MKQSRFSIVLISVAGVTLLASCQKKMVMPTNNHPKIDSLGNGIFILNQGSGYGSNIQYNSSLTFYNQSTKALVADQFSVANAMGIGAIGNDMAIYGSKMYIVATISSVVDIVDPKTARLIKQDSLLINNYVVGPPLYWDRREPRNIAFYKGNALISCYDGTVAVMDTATLSITKYIQVGRYPEGMALSNGKLYVANSGAGGSNSVSVIDLNTMSETQKITVIPYPLSVVADAYGNIYVASRLDDIFVSNGHTYPDSQTVGGLTIIDSKTDQVKSQIPMYLANNAPITIQGDSLYLITGNKNIVIYSAKTQTKVSDNFITDGTPINNPFAITNNPASGEVFIGDAKDYITDGSLYAFDKTGKLEYSLTAGINPGKVVLFNH